MDLREFCGNNIISLLEDLCYELQLQLNEFGLYVVYIITLRHHPQDCRHRYHKHSSWSRPQIIKGWLDCSLRNKLEQQHKLHEEGVIFQEGVIFLRTNGNLKTNIANKGSWKIMIKQIHNYKSIVNIITLFLQRFRSNL